MELEEAVIEDPQESQRTIARSVGISQSSISRILCIKKFHPHRITLVQELKETDDPKRLQFGGGSQFSNN